MSDRPSGKRGQTLNPNWSLLEPTVLPVRKEADKAKSPLNPWDLQTGYSSPKANSQ